MEFSRSGQRDRKEDLVCARRQFRRSERLCALGSGNNKRFSSMECLRFVQQQLRKDLERSDRHQPEHKRSRSGIQRRDALCPFKQWCELFRGLDLHERRDESNLLRIFLITECMSGVRSGRAEYQENFCVKTIKLGSLLTLIVSPHHTAHCFVN